MASSITSTTRYVTSLIGDQGAGTASSKQNRWALARPSAPCRKLVLAHQSRIEFDVACKGIANNLVIVRKPKVKTNPSPYVRCAKESY
jgi:hypothetical protein